MFLGYQETDSGIHWQTAGNQNGLGKPDTCEYGIVGGPGGSTDACTVVQNEYRWINNSLTCVPGTDGKWTSQGCEYMYYGAAPATNSLIPNSTKIEGTVIVPGVEPRLTIDGVGVPEVDYTDLFFGYDTTWMILMSDTTLSTPSIGNFECRACHCGEGKYILGSAKDRCKSGTMVGSLNPNTLYLRQDAIDAGVSESFSNEYHNAPHHCGNCRCESSTLNIPGIGLVEQTQFPIKPCSGTDYTPFQLCESCEGVHKCREGEYLPAGCAKDCATLAQNYPHFGYCPNKNPDCIGICDGHNQRCPRSYGFVTARNYNITYGLDNAGAPSGSVKGYDTVGGYTEDEMLLTAESTQACAAGGPFSCVGGSFKKDIDLVYDPDWNQDNIANPDDRGFSDSIQAACTKMCTSWRGRLHNGFSEHIMTPLAYNISKQGEISQHNNGICELLQREVLE